MDDLQHPALPDEDGFVLPKSWLRHVHPRRGGAAVPVKPGDPAEAGRLVADASRFVRALLEGESGAAVRRYLDGEPDPAGAAAVGAAVVKAEWRHEEKVKKFRTFVDAWAAGHGPGFAADAVVERCRAVLAADRRFHNGRPMPRAFALPEQQALRRARTLLAAPTTPCTRRRPRGWTPSNGRPTTRARVRGSPCTCCRTARTGWTSCSRPARPGRCSIRSCCARWPAPASSARCCRASGGRRRIST
ncbi:hypothetical protein BJF79_17905 [Actinomadura sp. CNU-125]|uniref:hypothetical protein n=1 Tax=Actinomadura sp. CNU-125 TaxID=1904961 RepID=UPI00095FF351|nr:hypothetical protein [Actinomadura sp. CNU-125]OLT17426.1 hypothetical protein BJF79_17905 [Actinomadura sp. CNU-125]